uniref:Uncharacterized protein n=1 Tax=Micrurus lemniscatus lemniscatus TaxID=129467 RepID=A0A2D4HX26_MICLE
MESVQGKISEALCPAEPTDGLTNVWVEGTINSVINNISTSPTEALKLKRTHCRVYQQRNMYSSRENWEWQSTRPADSTMQAIRKLHGEITMDKQPHTTAIGCSSHGPNLFPIDFMKLDTPQRIHRRAEEVLIYAKATHCCH